jgi:peroxiredoxin Q/BCP
MKLVFIFLLLLAVVIFLFSSFYARVSLTVGDRAPSFTLQNESGETVTSDQLFSTGSVLLYFYPKSATWSKSCIKQSCSLRDAHSSFLSRNITIVGINYESPEEHQVFKDQQRLPFMLLSDPTKGVARSYGAAPRWPLFSPIPRRITFLITKGYIAGIIKNIDPAQHAEQIELVLEKKER